MEVKASLKHLRKSPKKVRLIADLVRGSEVNKALAQLKFSKKWASEPVIKLLESAVANAVNNFELDKDNLFVKEIKVNEGVTMHRWMPKAQGRATAIRKRSSHVEVVLGEIKESGKKGPKKQKVEAPVKLDKIKKEGSVEIETSSPEENKTGSTKEKGKKVVGSHEAGGRHGHAKIEGGRKGFASKLFQRKSG